MSSRDLEGPALSSTGGDGCLQWVCTQLGEVRREEEGEGEGGGHLYIAKSVPTFHTLRQ